MFIMFRVYLFHELEAAVISNVCSGDRHYPNSNTMHVCFASTYIRTQRKYVNCCFFLEPPSPYNSFHCFSSLIIEPSAAKLAATCTIWHCRIHQICMDARIFKMCCERWGSLDSSLASHLPYLMAWGLALLPHSPLSFLKAPMDSLLLQPSSSPGNTYRC